MSVASHLVQRPVLRPRKPLVAVRADVRLVVRVVTARVLNEVARLRERSAADFAGIRQLAAVKAIMDLQRRRTRELCPALLADVRLAAGVADAVIDQVLVACKTLIADSAGERPDAGVNKAMSLH